MSVAHGKRNGKRATSPSMEQYVEAIAHLLDRDGVCSVSKLADGIGVSRAAVSRAVRELASKGMVEHKSYGDVELTPVGHALAKALNSRHQTIYEFLSGVLALGDDEADDEACRLEHHLDDSLVDRLAQLTSFFRRETASSTKWRRSLEKTRLPERV